jgi:hypothetical protein
LQQTLRTRGCTFHSKYSFSLPNQSFSFSINHLTFSFSTLRAGTSKKETKCPAPKSESMKTLPLRQCKDDAYYDITDSNSNIQVVLSFIALEVFDTHKSTQASDAYAIGIIMYMVASDEQPFRDILFLWRYYGWTTASDARFSIRCV